MMIENSDDYCFYSEDFQAHIASTLKDLESKKEFSDVTLACNGKRIHAHKFIIAFSSPVLRSKLKQNLNQHPVIYLNNIDYRSLENLLKYMYQGEVNIAQEDVDSFFEVAENLKVRGLFEKKKNEQILKFSGEHLDKKTMSSSTKRTSRLDVDNDKVVGDQAAIKSKNSPKRMKLISNKHEATKDSDSDIKSDNIIKLSLENEKSRIMCKGCGKQFESRQVLAKHIASIHEGTHFSCNQCNKMFDQIINLHCHKESVHEDLHFNCEQCEYKSTTKETLDNHMNKIHDIEMSGDMMNFDKNNGQISSNKECMKNSSTIKTRNTDDSEDDKKIRFISSGDLTKHIRTHTRQKPFQCPLCQKAFTQIAALNVHKRIHT